MAGHFRQLYCTLLCISYLASWISVTNAIYCEGLGDFDPEGPFVNFPDPTCPDDPSLDLVYTMFTSPTDVGEVFDRSTIPINFLSAQDSVFVVHGWFKDDNTTWMFDIKDRLLEYYELNVVLVGWGGEGGAENINYTESASTTRTIGAETAEVMMNLVVTGGADRTSIHCTGSSLGAHVCGHMGRWAADRGQKPGRITGMDPAGPAFITNSDRTVGLWNDCAEFVTVIHTTNSLGSTPNPGGLNTTLGHQDFFPNDGDAQPGCPTDNCGHGRAREYFQESIGNDCFISRERCTSSSDLPGSCSPCDSPCAVMGYGASLAYEPGIYRLDTAPTSPYCLG